MNLTCELPYLAGTCEACGVEYATGYKSQQNSNIQTGECELCRKSYCFDCQAACQCCSLKVCRGCTQSCIECGDTTCARCLAQKTCRFCAEDAQEEARMDAMSAAHDAQYASLNNGAWFCLTAVMLGAAAGLGWMWIGGGAL